MKIKLGWIVAGVCIVSIAWMVVPRLTFWISAATPSASDPARENQATPTATIESMFQMMSAVAGSELANTGEFNQLHLLEGKDMTPEEQAFSRIFWDTRRSGVLYGFMTGATTESPSVTDQQTNGDSAVVTVSASVTSSHSEETRSVIYTFDLKKRGPNWYVYELRMPKAPDGIFNYVKSKS